jgi:beta-glucanase (GH16 family)
LVTSLNTLACAGLPAPFSVGDLSAPALSALEITGGWTLVWNDEFDGTSIDPQRWTHLITPGVNGEQQYYVDSPENSYVAGGSLHIIAREETYGGGEAARPYTSAHLLTRLKGDWTYGRFEVRAKVPEGQGLWPTIWLMPTESYYGEWAASGEVDIAEFRGQEPGTVHGTIHYGAPPPRNTYTGKPFALADGRTFADDLHVFTLIWEPGAMHWFVDGRHYQSQTSWWSVGHAFPAPFDRAFHLILTLAVGGRFSGPPDETTEFPSELLLDYVRVYQR